MAFLFLIGGAFALVFPFVSVLAFFFAGIIGLAGGASTSFGDFERLGRRVFDPGRPQLLRLKGDAQEEARRRCQGSLVGSSASLFTQPCRTGVPRSLDAGRSGQRTCLITFNTKITHLGDALALCPVHGGANS
jgi:CubicO group peptidase (beta-lactamase class C family)